MIKRLIIAGIIVALFLGAVAYFQFVLKPEMIKGFMAKAAPPPPTVSAAPATVQTWTQRLPSIGTVTAVQAIDVSSQVAGIVQKIQFVGGTDVKEGEILVRLDISVEAADLISNKATLHQAQLDYERQVDLVRRGSTAQAKLDEAQAARDTAAASVQRTEAVIAQKTIRAPFTGRLGIRQVDLGQYVSPGLALVSLQSLDPIYVDFTVPEQNADVLATGQKVEAQFDSLPGQTFQGVIETLDARVNKDTRTLLVRAELANRERKLLPGMFANVAVLVGDPRATVTVPRTAVTYSLYGDSVFVVKPAEKKEGEAKPAEGEAEALMVERRFVRPGEVRGDLVAITEGLQPNEQVVTSGQLKLQSGARVTIDNAAPLTPQKPLPRQ
jgi:membrane fusion protein (multidrug efflux system)